MLKSRAVPKALSPDSRQRRLAGGNAKPSPRLRRLRGEDTGGRIRRGRLYLDVQRNAYGQIAVVPYNLRAKPEAPVAAPISRDQLSDSALDARRYTLKNLFRSLSDSPPLAGLAPPDQGLTGR